MNANTEHINIFIAYSRKDAEYMDQLRTHLTPLELSGVAKIWYDGEIAPGTNWEEEIKKHLFNADITLLLISANSFNSDYFYHKEMAKALQRHQEEEAIVIPVILSDCIWEITALRHLQALPKDGEPIDHWSKENSAYADIVRGVHGNVKIILDRREAIKKAEQKRIRKEKEAVEREKQRKAEEERQHREATKKAEQKRIRKKKEAVEREKQRKAEEERQRREATKKAEQKRIRKEKEAAGKAAKIATLPTPIQDLLRDMIYVQGGTFQMGTNDFKHTQPIHMVVLYDFKIGKYPITQAQYQAVTGRNPSRFEGNDKRPVENVSWNDAQDFIQKLNKMTGENFRLPIEAEWEFAARGGTKSNGFKYAGSNSICKVACYSYSHTKPVGAKTPNELDIHDMSGNVWEWCEDWYGAYISKWEWYEDWYGVSSSEIQQNPTNTYRILRGGSWDSSALSCHVSYRSSNTPDTRNNIIGFRLVSTVY